MTSSSSSARALVIGPAIGADLPVTLAMINEEAPEGRKGRMVAFTNILWIAGIIVTQIISAPNAIDLRTTPLHLGLGSRARPVHRFAVTPDVAKRHPTLGVGR